MKREQKEFPKKPRVDTSVQSQMFTEYYHAFKSTKIYSVHSFSNVTSSDQLMCLFSAYVDKQYFDVKVVPRTLDLYAPHASYPGNAY